MKTELELNNEVAELIGMRVTTIDDTPHKPLCSRTRDEIYQYDRKHYPHYGYFSSNVPYNFAHLRDGAKFYEVRNYKGNILILDDSVVDRDTFVEFDLGTCSFETLIVRADIGLIDLSPLIDLGINVILESGLVDCILSKDSVRNQKSLIETCGLCDWTFHSSIDDYSEWAKNPIIETEARRESRYTLNNIKRLFGRKDKHIASTESNSDNRAGLRESLGILTEMLNVR